MKITKEFKNSLAISLLLHMSIFIIFDITLFPQKGIPLRRIEISFFGSLLADYGKKEESFVLPLKKRLDSIIEEKTSLPLIFGTHQKQILYIVPEKPYREWKRKRLPSFFTERESNEIRSDLPSLSNFNKEFSSLPSAIRDMFYSDLSHIVIQEEENLNFKLRFFISENGVVEFIEPHFFSGNPELDIAVRKIIKGWSFLPAGNSGGWREIDFSPRVMARKDD